MGRPLRSQQNSAGAFVAFALRNGRHLRSLALCAVVGLAAGSVYWALSAPIYSSTATLVIPREGSSRNLDASLVMATLARGDTGSEPTATPSIRGALPALAPNLDLFLSILQSDSMDREVVERFSLREHYGVELVVDAIDILGSRRSVRDTETGTIEIEIEDTDPDLAATIANFHGAALDRRVKRLETTEAGKQRVFVERRRSETEKSLGAAEESLKRFQETHKAFALSEQARGVVEEVALLKGEIIAEEVALEGARTTSAARSPDIIRRQTRIDAMKRKLEEQFGDAFGDAGLVTEGGSAGIDGLPFHDFPQLGLELGRLLREVEMQSTVFTLLTRQLEESKIAEARDMPKVQWIDRALPAEVSDGPLLGRVLGAAGLGALILGILFISLRETVDRLRREYARRIRRAVDETTPAPQRAKKTVEASARVA